MKSGWTSKPIGNVFKIVNGGTPKTGIASNWDGPHAWITPAEMGNLDTPYISESRRTLTDQGLRTGAELVPADSIILSSRAPIGHLVINEIPMAFNQGCKGLIPATGIDSKFAYYFLLTNVPLLESLGTGATFKELSSGKLKEVPFHFPELGEQHRIVSLLDEAFANIATAKANADKNFQNARELFDDTLQSLIDCTSSDRIKSTMADVCEITSKLVDPRDDQYLDLPHIGAGNIESKTSALIDIKTAREEILISGKFLFDESMVLYSKIRPYLMKVVCPDFNGLCSADIYPLAPKTGVITRDYLYYLLLAPAFTEYANKGSARAGMPKVNREHLFAYQFALPTVQEQKRISESLKQIASETTRLEFIYRQKLNALDELEKSMLHQAFSGQL